MMNKEHEAFVITMEECGELIQACSKMIRSGGKKRYRMNLQDEAGDVLAMIQILKNMGLLCEDLLQARVAYKNEKLKLYSGLFDAE